MGSAGRCQALLDQWQRTLSQGLWWGQASKCLVILGETMVPPGDSPGTMFSTIHKERAGKAPELWCGESESPDETPGQQIGLSLGDPDGPSPGELLVSPDQRVACPEKGIECHWGKGSCKPHTKHTDKADTKHTQSTQKAHTKHTQNTQKAHKKHTQSTQGTQNRESTSTKTKCAKSTHKKCAQSTHTRFAQTEHTKHTKHKTHKAHAKKAHKTNAEDTPMQSTCTDCSHIAFTKSTDAQCTHTCKAHGQIAHKKHNA